MSKHTPGPWSVVEKTDPGVISDWGIQIGGKLIHFFPYIYQFVDEARTFGGYVSNPEMHANARLIAAAPELLEALERSLNWLSSYPNNACMGENGPYVQARKAIAKATGETP